MKNSIFKDTVRAVKYMLLRSSSDTFDYGFIHESLKEIYGKREVYENFSINFSFLEPSFCFFFLFVFGDTPQTRECLRAAEERFRIETERGSYSTELLKKAIFKSCVASLQQEKKFSEVFLEQIMWPEHYSRKHMKKKLHLRVTPNSSLRIALNDMSCGDITFSDVVGRKMLNMFL